MPAEASFVHRARRGRRAALTVVAGALGMAACHRKPDPSKNVPIVSPSPLVAVDKTCGDAAASLLSPAEIERTCGLQPGQYLGVGAARGCQYIFQIDAGDKGYVRVQTRTDMTVQQAFDGVKVRPVAGIGAFAEEGYIRGDLWIVAAEQAHRLAYIEADRRLCSEPRTATLLQIAVGHIGQAPASEPASEPAGTATRSTSPPASRR